MSRSLTFKLRVNKKERLLLGAVAERLARTRGDTIRFLVREAARELRLLPIPKSDSDVLLKGVDDGE